VLKQLVQLQINCRSSRVKCLNVPTVGAYTMHFSRVRGQSKRKLIRIGVHSFVRVTASSYQEICDDLFEIIKA
jgi:hypothetical protein